MRRCHAHEEPPARTRKKYWLLFCAFIRPIHYQTCIYTLYIFNRPSPEWKLHIKIKTEAQNNCEQVVGGEWTRTKIKKNKNNHWCVPFEAIYDHHQSAHVLARVSEHFVSDTNFWVRRASSGSLLSLSLCVCLVIVVRCGTQATNERQNVMDE